MTPFHARRRWRRERDSNPRYDFTSYNGLANRRLQPLGHLSQTAPHYTTAAGTKPMVARDGRADAPARLPQRPADAPALGAYVNRRIPRCDPSATRG